MKVAKIIKELDRIGFNMQDRQYILNHIDKNAEKILENLKKIDFIEDWEGYNSDEVIFEILQG